MEAPITVRPVGSDDIHDLGGVLGRAYQDDPMWAWLWPDAERRARFLDAYFELALRKLFLRLPGRHVSTTSTGAGVAIWAEPDHWRVPPTKALGAGPGMLRILGMRNLVRSARLLNSIEKHHPNEPHWYLEALGTVPAQQGKGLGGHALASVLRRCDTEGVPVWTWSSNERNLAFYYRHGFEVLDTLDFVPGGPPIFPIRRDPRPLDR